MIGYRAPLPSSSSALAVAPAGESNPPVTPDPSYVTVPGSHVLLSPTGVKAAKALGSLPRSVSSSLDSHLEFRRSVPKRLFPPGEKERHYPEAPASALPPEGWGDQSLKLKARSDPTNQFATKSDEVAAVDALTHISEGVYGEEDSEEFGFLSGEPSQPYLGPPDRLNLLGADSSMLGRNLTEVPVSPDLGYTGRKGGGDPRFVTSACPHCSRQISTIGEAFTRHLQSCRKAKKAPVEVHSTSDVSVGYTVQQLHSIMADAESQPYGRKAQYAFASYEEHNIQTVGGPNLAVREAKGAEGGGGEVSSGRLGMRRRTAFTEDQKHKLNDFYEEREGIRYTPQEINHIAGEVGISPHQVRIYFQNRRARTKLKHKTSNSPLGATVTYLANS